MQIHTLLKILPAHFAQLWGLFNFRHQYYINLYNVLTQRHFIKSVQFAICMVRLSLDSGPPCETLSRIGSGSILVSIYRPIVSFKSLGPSLFIEHLYLHKARCRLKLIIINAAAKILLFCSIPKLLQKKMVDCFFDFD